MAEEIRFRRIIGLFLLGFVCHTSHTFAGGGISTDGSLGQPARIISAPNSLANVEIKQNEGATLGRNLFHSFAKFNIESGQAVTFTENTTNALDNVISRVTGGTRSEINGTLRSTPGGHANFYLINPSGVIFGQNASIDVPATFHVNTADELNFKSGGKFSASQPTMSSISATEPTAFGFLGTSKVNNGLIEMNRSFLNFNNHPVDVDFISGQIKIKGALLIGENIRMVAVRGKGEVSAEKNLPLPNQIPTPNNSGDIKISDFSNISGNGYGTARVALWGNNTILKDSSVVAYNLGIENAARGVEIKSNYLKIDAGPVYYIVTNKGKGGDITVNSNSIDVINGGRIINEIPFYGSGDAGKTVITAANLNLMNGGTIKSATSGVKGHGSNIIVSAKNIKIEGAETGILSISEGLGNAGSITVNTINDLNLKRGGLIGSVTALSQGGNLIINAKNVVADGEGTTTSGMLATSNGIGNVGNINIKASGDIKLFNGGFISGVTKTTARGGHVEVFAYNLIIDGKGTIALIDTTTHGSGDAGNLIINVKGDLSIKNTGVITAFSIGSGHAGNIQVTASNVTIDGKNNIETITGIEATAHKSGNAGHVSLSTGGNLNLNNGGLIITSSLSKGSSGDIEIKANNVNIDGDRSVIVTANSGLGSAGKVIIHSNRMLTIKNEGGIFSINTGLGNGGNVELFSKNITLQNSGITTSVTGSAGNGGNIDIIADALVMETGLIRANTGAAGGSGGDINLNLKALIASGNMLTVGGSNPISWQPGIFGQNVIQAAAPNGINGQIQSSAPQLNISGELANLGSPKFDRNFLSVEYCSLGSGSSLRRLGKGGLQPKASDAWVY